jgi:hypothetical protein
VFLWWVKFYFILAWSGGYNFHWFREKVVVCSREVICVCELFSSKKWFVYTFFISFNNLFCLLFSNKFICHSSSSSSSFEQCLNLCWNRQPYNNACCSRRAAGSSQESVLLQNLIVFNWKLKTQKLNCESYVDKVSTKNDELAKRPKFFICRLIKQNIELFF